MAVWAAIRPKSSGVTSRDLIVVEEGLDALRLQLGLLGLAALARSRGRPGCAAAGRARSPRRPPRPPRRRLDLGLELLVEQLLLEVLGDEQFVDTEVGGRMVELDLGVLGGAGGLLVGGEEGVLEGVHQRVRGDSLLHLERLDCLDDLLGHATTSSSSGNRFDRRTASSGMERRRRRDRRSAWRSSASARRPVKLLRPSISSRVLTRTRWPRNRWKCSGFVSGPLRARGRDLQRVVLEQVAEQVRDPLAERQVDAAVAVDEEAQPLGGRPLEREHLDLRRALAQPGSRPSPEGLSALRRSFLLVARGLRAKKRWARAHLSTRNSGAEKFGREYRPEGLRPGCA